MDALNYENKYVAYLDVLGFKNLVFSKNKANQEKIARYFGLIERIISDLKGNDFKSSITSLVVSDSVILTMPFTDDRSENLVTLRALCFAIREIQFELSKIDIWLRGAVTYGEAYVSYDENQIVGEAFINAYLLEEKTAIFPRVIIDNKLINKLKTLSADTFIKIINGNQKSKGVSFLPKRILFDWNNDRGYSISLNKDVALFIDYLDLALNDEKSLGVIIKNISLSIYSDPVIYSKFRWLVDYLITIFEQQIHDGGYEDSTVAKNHLKNLKQL